MTRAARFLSDQFAHLHHRCTPSSTLLQSRQLTCKHHPPRAIDSAPSVTNPLNGFFDAPRIVFPSATTSRSQARLLSLRRRDIQLPTVWNPPLRLNHSSASPWIVVSLASLLGGLVLYAIFPGGIEHPHPEESLSHLSHITTLHSMPTEIQPGRPETLTKEEEEKLRELWIALFKLCGVSITDGSKLPDDVSSIKTETKEKKKRSLFRRVTGGKDDDDEPAFAPGDEDKYGLNKVYEAALKSMTPSEIRESIWGMVKIDNPDAILLRFLRARKWDVQKSLVMMISTMKWRTKDMMVDEDIMKNGELINIDEKEVISPTKKKLANDVMSQLVMGKSFLHGLDKEERPMCFIRVRLHKPGAQSNESLERFTVYQIETTRLMMLHPVDTANICFDMTDFGLSNLDYAPIKFIIKCFEANYPESLGVVLIHKAPWIFQGIWKIIKGWLDPVVAAKVHFTNSKEEMQEYIDINRMTPELEGEEKWEYKYIEPVPGENDTMKDTATRDKLQAERNKIVEDYEKTTAHWLNSSGEEAEAAKAKRTKLAGDLRDSYWQMDPYIRARSLYDRMGVIQPGGKINFYPWLTESTEALNGTEKTEEKINGSAVAPAAAEVKTEAVNGTAAPVATEEKTVTPNGAATAETVETAA